MSVQRLGLAALALALVLPAQADARVMQRIKSGADELTVTCDPAPIASDYAATAASGIPLTDPYAVQRDADKGLIMLMNEGRRRVKSYVIPKDAIRAIVAVKPAETDRADLVFTQNHLTLVHTTTANAGIFIVSDVYELPYQANGVDEALVKDDADLTKQLNIGLRAYDRTKRQCIAP